LGIDHNDCTSGGHAFRARYHGLKKGRGYGRNAEVKVLVKGMDIVNVERAVVAKHLEGWNIDMSRVSIQALLPNIYLNDPSFLDDEWYGFHQERRDVVNALQQLKNGGQRP